MHACCAFIFILKVFVFHMNVMNIFLSFNFDVFLLERYSTIFKRKGNVIPEFNHSSIMPPTLKKLVGHIALGLSVYPCVRVSAPLFS